MPSKVEEYLAGLRRWFVGIGAADKPLPDRGTCVCGHPAHRLPGGCGHEGCQCQEYDLLAPDRRAQQPLSVNLDKMVTRLVMIAMIRIIPHETQRYPTVGDWTDTTEDCLIPTVSVSDLGNRDYEFLIAMHELTEMYLCQRDGVSGAAVTAFDREYELRRPAGDRSEPGDCPDAPYYEQHRAATRIEMELAEELGVDWDKYSAFVDSIH